MPRTKAAAADLVRIRDISDRTGISRGTLSTWRTRGKIRELGAGVYSWSEVRPILVGLVAEQGPRRGQGTPEHNPIEEWPS